MSIEIVCLPGCDVKNFEIVCFPGCDVKHLEINLIFNEAVLLHHKKVKKKN